MITSTSNPQVKELIRMMKKSRAREEAGVFLLEGPRMAGELTGNPQWQKKIVKIYISESYKKKYESEIKKLLNNYNVECLTDSVFAHVSDTKTPQGILAVVKRRYYNIEDILGTDQIKANVLILENIQDPGNLGTIFRTAEAAGATGIIMSSGCVDLYNPKVVRSTMGAVLRVPFLYVDDLPGTAGELKKKGIRIFAAHLDGKNAYDAEDYRGACAFMIGNEGNGLSDEASACADCLVRIPMHGEAESLNAAVASAVLMYEADRQRRIF